MSSRPQMVRVSYTNILTKLCGVNHFMNQILHGKVHAKCSCCPHVDETTEHIILCHYTAITRLDHDAGDKLGQWMKSQQTDLFIQTLVLKYLKGRKQLTMCKYFEGSRSLTLLGWILAQTHDCLEWCNFVEGRIACK